MPYISASIVVQLLTVAVPRFAKLQKEGDSGRKKLNQWTRVLTILITAGAVLCIPESNHQPGSGYQPRLVLHSVVDLHPRFRNNVLYVAW
ncbi:MAG: hypothetical protein WDO15_19385 [Bacteroidota bacterium]